MRDSEENVDVITVYEKETMHASIASEITIEEDGYPLWS